MKREKDPQAQRYPRPAPAREATNSQCASVSSGFVSTAERVQLILQVETKKLAGRRVRGDGRNFEKYSKV